MKPNHPAYKEIDDMALNARYLKNHLNYRRRQRFFNKEKPESELSVRKEMTRTKPQEWINLPSKIARDVSRGLDQEWRSFWSLLKDHKDKKPKPPGYLKNGTRSVFIVSHDALKIKSLRRGVVGITKVSQPLCKIPFDASLVKCVRVIPCNKNYVIEIIWDKKESPNKNSSKTIAGVDLGIDNLMTVVCDDKNIHPLIIDGKHTKWLNRSCNRQAGKLKQRLMCTGRYNTSRELTSLWNNRNARIKHEIHWATRQVVRYCVENNVSTVIIGWNKGWKSHSTKNGNTLGRKSNQSFRAIPMRIMVDILTYKLREKGIEVMETEESYTSKTSVIDHEVPCKHNKYAGKRKHRGLFVSSDGTKINADVNGAAQIVRKCKPNAFDWVDGVTAKVCLDKPTKVYHGNCYRP